LNINLLKEVTVKIYVGQTMRTLEQRFAEHAKADSLLGNAIRKYGAENFSIEILTECETKAELDDKERLYIEKLNYKHPHGYNFCLEQSEQKSHIIEHCGI